MSTKLGDIPVEFYNSTGRTDFQVMVSTKNFDISAPPEDIAEFAAWEVLKTQSSASFIYPGALAVGCTYTQLDTEIKCGPFEAKEGSTWEIVQEMEGVSPILHPRT